jgi:hypothetical protein
MNPSTLLHEFQAAKAALVGTTVGLINERAQQTTIDGKDFAVVITIACDPAFGMDVSFVLADLLQSTDRNKADREIEGWTQFRGGESMAPPDQCFRKKVLCRIAAALNNSICT